MPTKHSVEVITHELDLNEELELHEHGWLWQKVGWAFILGVIVTAALGLYGDGMLSTQNPISGNFMLEYDKFNRYEHEMEVLVQSNGEAINTISFPQTYLKDMRLVRIVPDPLSNEATNDNVTFNFAGDHEIISIYIRPESPGTFEGTMRINNDASFNIYHFIYP